MSCGDELEGLAQEGEVLLPDLFGRIGAEPGFPLGASEDVIHDRVWVLVGRPRRPGARQMLRVVRWEAWMELRRANYHQRVDVREAISILQDDGDEAVALLVRSAVLEDGGHDVGAVRRVGETCFGEHVLKECPVSDVLPKEPVRRVEHACNPDKLRKALVARKLRLGNSNRVPADHQVVDQVVTRSFGVVAFMELHHVVVERHMPFFETVNRVHGNLVSLGGKLVETVTKNRVFVNPREIFSIYNHFLLV